MEIEMTQPSADLVDLFSNASATNDETKPDAATETTETVEQSQTGTEQTETDSDSDSDSDTNETPDEQVVVSEVPDGAMSPADFAQWASTERIKAKLANGEAVDGSEYIAVANVYNRANRANGALPHVWVGPSVEDGKLYILANEALAVWDTMTTRGAGRGGSSAASPEDNERLFKDAVTRQLWATYRRDQWQGKLNKLNPLVTKRERFAAATGTDVEAARAAAQAEFEAEQAAKAAARKRTDADADSDTPAE
jgi:hypothetical protein